MPQILERNGEDMKAREEAKKEEQEEEEEGAVFFRSLVTGAGAF